MQPSVHELAAMRKLYKLDSLSPKSWIEVEQDGLATLASRPKRFSTNSHDQRQQQQQQSFAREMESDPLGLKRTLLQDKSFELQVATSLSSKAFDPAKFLAVEHPNASFSDLQYGLETLQRSVDERSHQLRVLVEDNFDKFVLVKAAVDNVHAQLAKTVQADSSASQHGTRRARTIVNQASSKAEMIFLPVLENSDKAQRLRNTLSVYEGSKFFLNLPRVLVGHMADGKPEWVLRDWKKAKALHSGQANGGKLLVLPSSSLEGYSSAEEQNIKKRLFEKVWTAVDRIMAEVKAELSAQLRDSARPMDEQEKIIGILLELEGREDPILLYSTAQHAHATAKFKEIHANHLKDIQAQLLKHDHISKQQELAQFAQATHSVRDAYAQTDIICDTPNGRPCWSLLYDYIKSLSEELLQCQAKFWRMTRLSGAEGAQHQSNITSASADLTKLYVTLISEFFNLSDIAIAIDAQNSAESTVIPKMTSTVEMGHWMRKILAEILDTIADLDDKTNNSQSAISLRKLVENMRWRFLQIYGSAWRKESCSLRLLEDWKVDPDRPSCTLFLNLVAAYHTYTTSVIYRLAGVIEDQKLLGTAIKLNSTRPPTQFVARIKESSLGAIYDLIDEMVNFSEPEPENKVNDAILDHDSKLLFTMNNAADLKANLFPAVLKDLERMLRLKLDADKTTLSEVLGQLDEALFQNFLKRKTRVIQNTMDTAMLHSNVDWSNSGKPTEIRAAVFGVLLHLVAVHAQITNVVPALVHRFMSALADDLATATLNAISQIPAFNVGGVLKATLEIEFVNQTLIQFLTPQSQETFTKVYHTISRNQRAQTDKESLQRDLETIKKLLTQVKHDTAITFASLRPKKRREASVTSEQAADRAEARTTSGGSRR